MPGDCGINDANQKRLNLRWQLLSGESKHAPHDRHGEDWLKKNWPAALDAHFACPVPGESVALADVLHMLIVKQPQMTCPGSKKEVKEPRKLSEAELLVIREWYDRKDKQLEEARGQSYVAQRNLSAQARVYHEASSANHKETQALLRAQAASQDSKLDRLLAFHKAPGQTGALQATEDTSSQQRYLWAREKALEERRAEYGRLCAKFGHSHAEPPAKIGEYIKAIADLKRQIALREKETKAKGETALLAAKQTEFEASLALCTNPDGCHFAAKDTSTWTLHEKLRHSDDAITVHRSMAEEARAETEAKRVAKEGATQRQGKKRSQGDAGNAAAAGAPAKKKKRQGGAAAAKRTGSGRGEAAASATLTEGAPEATGGEEPTRGAAGNGRDGRALKRMKLPALQAECAKQGLDRSGKKHDLIARLALPPASVVVPGGAAAGSLASAPTPAGLCGDDAGSDDDAQPAASAAIAPRRVASGAAALVYKLEAELATMLASREADLASGQ